MPRPPRWAGKHTEFQAIVFMLFLISKLPHKKHLMCLSISEMHVFGRRKLQAQYICNDETVDLMSSTLPAKDNIFDFQPTSRFLILSISGLQADKLNLVVKRGRPRYFDGKDSSLKLRVAAISSLSCKLQLEKRMELLAWFKLSPVWLPNPCKKQLRLTTKAGEALSKIIISSANKRWEKERPPSSSH